jgi:hypothetical protein
MVASYTRVPPVRLLDPVCWRMLGGPPGDTSKTPGCPLGLLLQGVGRQVDGGLLYSGAACETLRPRVLEDAWRTSGGHLRDLRRPLGLLLQGVGRRAGGGLLYSDGACEDL